MAEKIDINSIYKISEDIVAREIEGELIIIPITSGIGDAEDDLFSMNETGGMIWGLIDGKKSVKKIINEVSLIYKSEKDDIEEDVKGILSELEKRHIIIST